MEVAGCRGRSACAGIAIALAASLLGCTAEEAPEPQRPEGGGGWLVLGGATWVGTLELDKDTGRPTDNYCQKEFHASFGRWMHVDSVFLDTEEVKVREYEECVEAGGCPTRPFPFVKDPSFVHFPASLDLEAAEAYCAYRNGRLPTYGEMARAASGGSIYPVARNLYDLWLECEYWNFSRPECKDLASRTYGLQFVENYEMPLGPNVKSRPDDDLVVHDLSPFGHWGLFGGQAEWTSSRMAADSAEVMVGCELPVVIEDPETYTKMEGDVEAQNMLFAPGWAMAFPVYANGVLPDYLHPILPRNFPGYGAFFGARCAYDPVYE